MIRNLKALGLAVVAVLAMSVVVASAAQAAPVVTISAGASVSVHATGENIGEKLSIDGVTTECKTSHYTGTATSGSSTLTLNPTYTGCTLAGTGLTVHVTTTGCGYLFHLQNKSGSTNNASVDIECGASPIKIEGTGTSCVATIGAQSGLSNVSGTNDATDVTIKSNVSGIKATVVTDGFLCPFNGTGAKTGGTYTSTGYLTGTAASGTIQVSGE
jgi:hypothetical protein